MNMRLKNIDALIKKMQSRLTRLIEIKDAMHDIDPRTIKGTQRIHLATRYNDLVSRIDELNRIIDGLIDAVNLDRTVWDRRQSNDRRGQGTRRGVKT